MGSRPLILLDTHALVWLDRNDRALGQSSRRRSDDALRLGWLAVSAISFWEVAVLVAKRRFSLAMPTASWRHRLLSAGLREIPVDGEIGIAANELAQFHPDPSDRLIVATAIVHGATLITADGRILAWPGALARLDART